MIAYCATCRKELQDSRSSRCAPCEQARRRGFKHFQPVKTTDMTNCRVHGHTKAGRPPKSEPVCTCITPAMLEEEQLRRERELVRFWCGLCGEDDEQYMTAVELGRTSQKYCQRCGSRMFAESVGPSPSKIFRD